MHDIKNPVDRSIKTVMQGIDLLFNNTCEIMLSVGKNYYKKAAKIKYRNVDFKNLDVSAIDYIPFTTLVTLIDGDMDFIISNIIKESTLSNKREHYCTDNEMVGLAPDATTNAINKRVDDVRLGIFPNPSAADFMLNNRLDLPVMEIRTSHNYELRKLIYGSPCFSEGYVENLLMGNKTFTHDNVFTSQSLDQISDSLQGARIKDIGCSLDRSMTSLYVDIDTLVNYIFNYICDFDDSSPRPWNIAKLGKFTTLDREDEELYRKAWKEAQNSGLLDEETMEFMKDRNPSLTTLKTTISSIMVLDMMEYMEKSENPEYKPLLGKLERMIHENKLRLLNRLKMSAVFTAAAWHGSYANMNYGQDVLNLIYNDILKDNANDFELLYRKHGKEEGHKNKSSYIGEQARSLTFKLNSVLYMLLKYTTKYGSDNRSIGNIFGNNATPEVFATFLYRLFDAYTEYSTVIGNSSRNIVGFDSRGRFVYEDTVKLANSVMGRINDPALVEELNEIRDYFTADGLKTNSSEIFNDARSFWSTGYENMYENYKAIASICKHTIKSASLFLVHLLEYEKQRKMQTSEFVLADYRERLDDAANRLSDLGAKLNAMSCVNGYYNANIFNPSDREACCHMFNLMPMSLFSTFKFTRGRFFFRPNALRANYKDVDLPGTNSEANRFENGHKRKFEAIHELRNKIIQKSKAGTIAGSNDGSSIKEYNSWDDGRYDRMEKHEISSVMLQYDGYMADDYCFTHVKTAVSLPMMRYMAKVLEALITEDFIELYQDSTRVDNYNNIYWGAQAEFNENALTTTTLPVLDSQVPMAFFGQQSSEAVNTIVYPLLMTPLMENKSKNDPIVKKYNEEYYNYLVKKGVLNDRRSKS